MSECAICGDDGVSVDPRFRQGDWCELCQTTWSMLEAKWIKENQDNRREMDEYYESVSYHGEDSYALSHNRWEYDFKEARIEA